MELPKEWEAIVGEMGCRKIVERCYALHSKPKKELTPQEKYEIWERCYDGKFDSLVCKSGSEVVDKIIAAYWAKQREPETVTFRAARHKASERIEMLVPERGNLNCDWEWLEPPQTFEVVLP